VKGGAEFSVLFPDGFLHSQIPLVTKFSIHFLIPRNSWPWSAAPLSRPLEADARRHHSTLPPHPLTSIDTEFSIDSPFLLQSWRMCCYVPRPPIPETFWMVTIAKLTLWQAHVETMQETQSWMNNSKWSSIPQWQNVLMSDCHVCPAVYELFPAAALFRVNQVPAVGPSGFLGQWRKRRNGTD